MYLCMLSGNRILVTAFLRAVALMVIIVLCISATFANPIVSQSLLSIFNLAFALILASLFSFLTSVLIKIKEKNSVIIGFAAYSVILLLPIPLSLLLHLNLSGKLNVVVRIVSLAIVANLLIQGQRMRPSSIRKYFRTVAITIFTAMLIKVLNVPLLVYLFNFHPSQLNMVVLQTISSITLALHILISISVIMIVNKLKHLAPNAG